MSTYVVNTTVDTIDHPQALMTLREAIRLANDNPGNDTITFDPPVFTPGTSHTITLTFGRLKLTDTTGLTTITGPGEPVLTVDSSNVHRAMVIGASVNAAITNLTFEDNFSGAIITAGHVAIRHIDIELNPIFLTKASPGGGGITNTGSLTLRHSSVSGQANIEGGAIYSSGPLDIATSHFSNNYSGDGGAIYSNAPLKVSSSVFTFNTAYYGGAIEGDTVVVDGSAFGHNSCTEGEGGAIFANSLYATSSLFKDNVNDPDSHFLPGGGPSAGFGGGAICAQNASLIRTSVIGNSSPEGGGVSTSATLVIVESTLSGNTCEYNGGAVYCSGTSTVIATTVDSNSIVSDPSTYIGGIFGAGFPGYGGGFYNEGSLTVTNSTIVNNTAKGEDADAGGNSAGANGGNAAGGGIYNSGSLTAANCTITGNAATGGFLSPSDYPGGNIHSGHAVGGGISGECVLLNSIVSGNYAYDNSFPSDLQAIPADPSSNIIGSVLYEPHGSKTTITNPMLAPLADNGGPTLTMLPLPGSPALNSGSNAIIPPGLTTDQRGFPRIYNGTIDIGAVEVQPVATISGQVFNDANGNGELDPGETGLANFRVFIDQANDGIYTSTDPSVLTDSTGDFTFTNLTPGTYILRIVPLPGYALTTHGSLTFGVGPGSVRAGNLFGEEPILA